MIFNESSNYYQEFGNGEPLILIAGLASDSQSWLPVVVGLSKHFRVIIFDNRGVGRSSNDNTNITIQKMTDDCADLIRHLNLSSANILGHSMGGIIAMDLAIRYPNLVKKLILEATSPKLNMRNINVFNDWVSYLNMGMDKKLWFKNIFYWIFLPAFFDDAVMLNQSIDMSVNYPYPQSDISFKNQIDAISKINLLPNLKKIDADTLVMYGEFDLLFPSNENSLLFNDITHLQTVTISNAAHSIHVDNPVCFTNSVISFIIDH
jgi:pimeloyl-ACP methyl ester carboxylesterase